MANPKGYIQKAKKRYAESHIGDERVDIDYDELYGNNSEEEIDWDEDFGEDDDSDDNESYHGVEESAVEESAFEVDESAFAEESEEFDPDSYVSEEEEDEEEGEEEPSGPSAFSRLSEGASGMLSKLNRPKKQKTPKKKKEKEVESSNDVEQITDEFSQSVFAVSSEDNESVLNKITGKAKKSKQERESAAKDVLEILSIPETFSIEERYYLPSDLKHIKFSIGMPEGYAFKEVDKFHSTVKKTIQHFVDLLHERNAHIMTLAAEVDKKDDVIKKMQYDQEVAQGISVMPTQGDTHLENELIEARAVISRLRQERNEALARAEGSEEKIGEAVGLSKEEREKYNDLQDAYSVLQRKNENYERRERELKSKILLLEEENSFDPSDSFVFEDDRKNNPKPKEDGDGSRSIALPKL